MDGPLDSRAVGQAASNEAGVEQMVPGMISSAVPCRAYNPVARVLPLVLSASHYRRRLRPVLHQPPPDPLSSTQLLARLKTGDDDAFTLLMKRYLVPLRRWAHGRLPT